MNHAVLLTDADSFTKFIATHPVLAVSQHPESNHPLIKTHGRIFHHSSNFDGELLLTDVAEPDAPRFDERVLRLPATWTGNVPANPAHLDGIVESTVSVGEVGDCVLQSLWFVKHEEIVR